MDASEFPTYNNLWAGFLADSFLVPYVPLERPTGGFYRVYISKTLPDLLEYVPLLRPMWFMPVVSPAPFSHIVSDALSDIYHEICIDREEQFLGLHVLLTSILLTYICEAS